MSSFIRKGGTIEAFIWTGGPDQTEDPEWAVQAIKNKIIFFSKDEEHNTILCINVPSGVLVVESGDYVVKEADGEFNCYTPRMFNRLYEPLIN